MRSRGRPSVVPAADEDPPPSPRRRLVLVAMTGSPSMIMLDQTVVAVALPSMAQDLALSPHGEQWVLNAYVLAIAALVALGGRVADQLGRVRTFRLGVMLFFLASAGCAASPTGPAGETTIIAFRALQGRRPLRPPFNLAQHLPDPRDRGLDVDPGALFDRAILPLVASGDRPGSRAVTDP